MQVAIYNYMKLQLIRAKASQSAGKDVEKHGGAERQALLGNNHSSVKIAADSVTHAPTEGGHSFSQIRCRPVPPSCSASSSRPPHCSHDNKVRSALLVMHLALHDLCISVKALTVHLLHRSKPDVFTEL